MYLVSLYFDEKTNNILQNYITKVAKESGNMFMLEHKVPPHLTISAIEARNVEILLPVFKDLENKLQAGKIQIVSVGQLLPYVIYATPVLNSYLQEIISMVYGAVSDINETKVSKYYKPNSWLPHITLGKKLDSEQMISAFRVLQTSFVPFAATVTEIGLAKVNPHMDVERFVLNKI